MRAIVTGGAGFIGTRLTNLLLDRGWEVWVVDDLRTGTKPERRDGLHWINDEVGYAFPYWTLPGATTDDFVRVPDCDAIFHLASPVGPTGVLKQAGRIVFDVVIQANSVREWARRYGCPLVYVSTSEVYGSGQQDAEADSCHFAAPTSARKEYAVAKLATETMLRNSAGLDVRIVRPFNVAGPGQKPDGGFVLPRFVRQALAGEALTVYEPGSQRRAFAHVTDIAEGILAAYERGRPGEVYNLGNPENACTIAQLAKEVIKTVGSGHIEVIDPVALHGPDFREAPDKVPNIDRAIAELGWYPKHDRASVIADTIAYWR